MKKIILSSALLLSSCARVTLNEKAEPYGKLFKANLADLFEETGRDVNYPDREQLRTLAGSCLTEGACKKETLKKWVSLLPRRDYFDRVAKAQKDADEKFAKVSTKIRAESPDKGTFFEELLNLQKLSLDNVISGNVFTTTIQFPQIARQLQFKKLWDKPLLKEFSDRLKDYICGPVFGIVDLRIRANTLATQEVRDLLGSYDDFSGLIKSYEEYKKKNEEEFKVKSDTCNKFMLKFSEACLVKLLRPIRERSKLEKSFVETYGKNFQTIKACTSAPQ